MNTTLNTAACADLTAFQRDLLAAVVREGPCSGQTIKYVLEPSRADEINPGWLYPTLDALVEMGLVTKGRADKRTNSYEPTARGRRELVAYLDWLLDCAEGQDA
jgi:PadR family transcriptional regulator PadR